MQRDLLKFKSFLVSPLILSLLRKESPLLLYISVIDQAMSLVLVQETDKVERLMYFVSKVFRGAETRY